jgi:hypothetical protein
MNRSFKAAMKKYLLPLSWGQVFQLYVNYALGVPIAVLIGRGKDFRQFMSDWVFVTRAMKTKDDRFAAERYFAAAHNWAKLNFNDDDPYEIDTYVLVEDTVMTFPGEARASDDEWNECHAGPPLPHSEGLRTLTGEDARRFCELANPEAPGG